MSSNNPLLETLIDPTEPALIDMFPQTIGWKIVAVVAMVLLILAVYKTIKHWRANAYRREAIEQVTRLEQRVAEQSLTKEARVLNRLTKQCASITYGNAIAASLEGENWYQLLTLNDKTPLDKDLFGVWQSALYRPNGSITVQQFNQLTQWVKRWIAQHKSDDVTEWLAREEAQASD
jgi:hypothetical protein